MLRPYIPDSAAFEPDAIDAMSKAFENACAALHVYAGDEQGRLVIATRIIDLARSGVVDTAALSKRIVEESRAIA